MCVQNHVAGNESNRRVRVRCQVVQHLAHTVYRLARRLCLLCGQSGQRHERRVVDRAGIVQDGANNLLDACAFVVADAGGIVFGQRLLSRLAILPRGGQGGVRVGALKG